MNREKLIAALQQLPGPSVGDIEAEADHFRILAGFATVAKLPRFQATKGKSEARKELDKLARLSARLAEHLNAMHGDTLQMVDAKGGRSPSSIGDLVTELKGRAVLALRELPEKATNTSPAKLEKIRLAKVCALYYSERTGNKPALGYNDGKGKPDGPFVRFLQEVFEAFEVSGTAGHYAKAAMAGDYNDIRGGYAPRMGRVEKT